MKESVHLKVDGNDILGELYLPDGEKPFPTLCLCHGIPSGKPPDPSDGGYPLLAEKFTRAGFATLIFNFRGAGISGGDFDIMGWTRDLQAAIDYLYSHPGVDKSRLYIMGFSGGAAAANYVAASDTRISRVVLCCCAAGFNKLIMPDKAETTIANLRKQGVIRSEDFPPSLDEWFEGFRYIVPPRWIDKISPRPLLIVHGDEDELIEVGQAWQLYETAGEPKEIAIIKGAAHQLRKNQEAMNITLEWLKRD
ncbi:alpha/beta hydrolase [Chloroflexota bacterium]